MKKKLFGLVALTALAAGALASCGSDEEVFHIYAWNEEFKGFFEKYVSDEKEEGKKKYHLDGVEVQWTITPSAEGQYQNALDLALKGNKKASKSKKVDMFLAEADYIQKYADSNLTQDVKKIGVTDMAQTYQYTVQAASDNAGVVKGVSFQCCPSALIYNAVVAKEVLGTDDPAKVQEKVSTWEKFDEVAALCKAKGKYMTACEADTYRVFANNATTPWVTADKKIQIPDTVLQWMEQADRYIKNGYTIASDVWGDDKVANIKADENNAFCTFGPAWYYNFCMGDSKVGDWRICEGPMAHFWGGTWLMAPTGADNTELTAKVMNAFINDEEVCRNLITNDGQFTNNQMINKEIAEKGTGNEFLGGQNDTALFVELAKNIKFENTTIYDQLCNEGLQEKYREYLKTPDVVSKDKALNNFYTYITEKYPSLEKA